MATDRVDIVDMEGVQVNEPARTVATFIGGPDVVEHGEKYVERLPGVTTGRYGIDHSINCGECGQWHSPEAECEITTSGVGWPD